MTSGKEKIAVIFGGPSAESSISQRSAENVRKALVEKGYDTVPVELNRDIWQALVALAPSKAYLITHGNPGEDGSVQGMLELLGIPYTYSGVLASALALDKKAAKTILSSAGIPVLRDIVVDASMLKGLSGKELLKRLTTEFRPPLIMKPVREGSSVGVSKISDPGHIMDALKEKTEKYGRILVEPFISAVEVTAGVLEENGHVTSFPLQELHPKKEFYDFEAKYTEGMTDFIIPARIPNEMTKAVKEAAVKAFRTLGCEGAGRIDFIVRPPDFWLLEVNTIPGMTDTSDLPAEAKASGIGFSDLVERILKSARLKK